MLEFRKINIDEEAIYDKASTSFFECAENILNDDENDFNEIFEGYSLSELKTQLFKIHYTKYIDNEFLGFDSSTEFHFEIHIHVYVVDKEGDTEQLAVYRLILNEYFEPVDDFLT